MKKPLKIGIVGCGAIGSSLAGTVSRDLAKSARLAALFDIIPDKSEALSFKLTGKNYLAVDSLEELIRKSDLVIEAAHANCSLGIARKAVSAGKDAMIMSVGGIVSGFTALTNLARQHNARIYVPSGAIAGIDALKAAHLGKVKSVVLSTRKNPLSFKGVKYIQEKNIQLDKIKKDTVIFSGSAQQAMKFFPQNVNVAGILSLAGIGPVKTRVRIIASPSALRNIHEIEIVSEAGNVFSRTENVLHPNNPKTSFLAVLSAVATLKQILQPSRVGT
jgi:aspartate dehydrogenase